jgi:hypothetical protein
VQRHSFTDLATVLFASKPAGGAAIYAPKTA